MPMNLNNYNGGDLKTRYTLRLRIIIIKIVDKIISIIQIRFQKVYFIILRLNYIGEKGWCDHWCDTWCGHWCGHWCGQTLR